MKSTSSETDAYQGIDVPVVKLDLIVVELVVEVVPLAIDVEIEVVPVVDHGEMGVEIKRHFAMADGCTCLVENDIVHPGSVVQVVGIGFLTSGRDFTFREENIVVGLV